ncbi:hypothetical protein SAMN06295945_1720 [Polynucleobacter meluiroseus]|uniref:Uncharacterized protein n=1 Tax=Polynucleobacter meluiroseus TaxID=1938814 RepID=A0A240E1N5_9BURK|nr:hypothetical protein [Polynucleobacter meluiroseus]SNX29349.1 hypothetical protein SAMN06295945_1720 [Polynucleobacter meluiroseus]
MFITIIAALCTLAFLALRFVLAQSAIRFLVDSYGLDRRKLKRLSRRDIASLKRSIQQCRQKNDPFALETLLRPYRP